ncbi:MAG: hypothetical protein MI864_17640 [Pseudomonadales bacterium]|nr:hypothetical protein [Pseudomonadales bacterium]
MLTFPLSIAVLAKHPAEKTKNGTVDHSMMDHSQMHQSRPVLPEYPVPEIELGIVPDAVSGYNLTLRVAHFNLIPPQLRTIEKKVQPGKEPGGVEEGHAHLYVNGTKIQRLYGRYVHLPATLFNPGINQITVTLNDHEHQNLSIQNRDIQATLTINTRKDDFLQFAYTSSPIRN